MDTRSFSSRKVNATRRENRLIASAAVLALLTLLTACGNNGSAEPQATSAGLTPSSQQSSQPSTQPGGGNVDTELTITVRSSQTAAPTSRKLLCSGAVSVTGSTLPNADAACAALAAKAEILELKIPDKDQMCTEQYGGPQTANVAGTRGGKSINVSFSMTDGCQISRWNAASILLGGAES